MQYEKEFILDLNGSVFKIPFDIINLFKINIYKKLISTQTYKVKSNVSIEVFDSFIKYLLKKETPNINSNNFFEYEELSNEFNVMNPLIQFYQNSIKISTNYSLMNKNQKLKARLKFSKKKLTEKKKNFLRALEILFDSSQNGTFYNKSSIKQQLLKSCQEENLKELEVLTKNEINQNGLLFILDEKEKTSSLYLNVKAKGDITIPLFIKHKKKKYFVNRIFENAFKNSKGVKSIQFPNNSKITMIEKSSLSCSSLLKIQFPSNINHFSSEFFCESEKLAQISIDSNNQNFSYYEDTFLIGKEDLNSENFDVLLFARRDLTEAIIPSFIKRIAPYAFESCKKLKCVSFSKDTQLKTIDKFAFFKSNLEIISIPSCVKRIGESAFSQCYKLKKVVFQNDSKLKSIGKDAFSFSSINRISIPSGIVRINDCTFSECRKLSTVEFTTNSKLKFIGRNAFMNSSIECISIPSCVIQIENKAFSLCSNLKKIDFENDSELLSIGKKAFCHTKIEYISIPSSVLDLQDGFFSGMKNLITINFNNNHFLHYQNKILLGKTDGKSDNFDIILFVHSSIESFTVFPYIKRIAAYSFDNCCKLQKVDFTHNTNLISIENHSFNCTGLKIIKIPSKILTIGKNAFALCSSLQQVEFESKSQLQTIENRAFAWSSLYKIVIPSTLTKICENAFYSCYNLKVVEFMKNSKLKIICKDAFASSGIEFFNLPESITEICFGAFYRCEHLKSIIFNENSNLKSINGQAFASSSIKCISIPKSVIEMNDSPFFNCINLEIIEFSNKTQFESIDIDSLFVINYINNNMIILVSN